MLERVKYDLIGISSKISEYNVQGAFLSKCWEVHDLGIDMKKEKSHSCEQCDEKFEWLSHLKRHIKSVHDGIDEDDFKEEG